MPPSSMKLCDPKGRSEICVGYCGTQASEPPAPTPLPAWGGPAPAAGAHTLSRPQGLELTATCNPWGPPPLGWFDLNHVWGWQGRGNRRALMDTPISPLLQAQTSLEGADVLSTGSGPHVPSQNLPPLQCHSGVPELWRPLASYLTGHHSHAELTSCPNSFRPTHFSLPY